MPVIPRYEQKYSPSGEVGSIRVNPEALTNDGAGMIGRGIESAGQSVSGLSDIFAKIQDTEDDIAVSTAQRQTGEHMAKLWDDIANEPDYKKHKALYDKAYATASGFAPKGSVNAGRKYQAFMDDMKPNWDSHFFSQTSRRRIQTIDADTKANTELDREYWKRSIRSGDVSGAMVAEWAVKNSYQQRVNVGVSTPAEAEQGIAEVRLEMDTEYIWSDAMAAMELGTMDADGNPIEPGIGAAEKVVMDSDLPDQQKDHVISDLHFHDKSNQVANERAVKIEMDQSETRIAMAINDAIDGGDFGAAKAALDNERPTFEKNAQGEKFLKWRAMLDAAVNDSNKGQKWSGRQDPKYYAELLVATVHDPNSVSNAEIDGALMDGWILPGQWDNLRSMKVRKLSDLGHAMQTGMIDRLDRLYMEGKDTVNPNDPKGFAETIITKNGWLWDTKGVTPVDQQFQTYLGLVGDVVKWYSEHPDASIEEYNEYNAKVGAVRTHDQADALRASGGVSAVDAVQSAQVQVSRGFVACPDAALATYWTQLTADEKSKAYAAISLKTIPMSKIVETAQAAIKMRTQPDAVKPK
jgi:hypothetical protein